MRTYEQGMKNEELRTKKGALVHNMVVLFLISFATRPICLTMVEQVHFVPGRLAMRNLSLPFMTAVSSYNLKRREVCVQHVRLTTSRFV